MIEQIKPSLLEPATPDQKQFAGKWDVRFTEPIERSALARLLFDFLMARAWAYGVCRDMAGTRVAVAREHEAASLCG